MAKYKILIVDDEESLCEILQFNLEVEGYEADVAYSAEQALEMHHEGEFISRYFPCSYIFGRIYYLLYLSQSCYKTLICRKSKL